jgi:hypothetical protein
MRDDTTAGTRALLGALACPKCGERGIAIAVSIATELNISGEVSVGL